MDFRKLIDLVESRQTLAERAKPRSRASEPAQLPPEFDPGNEADATIATHDNQPGPDNLAGLKAAIGHKIKELPPTKDSIKALEEVEDILSSINIGGRQGNVGKDLESINDRDVHKAKKLLSMYVLNLPISPAQRKKLFDAWRKDKLVDVDALRTLGTHTVNDIFPEYGSAENPGVKLLVDDLATVNFVGVGKGEFLLCVMSKRITKEGKGDLLIDGKHKVEVKTSDGGSPRMTDADSNLAPGYQAAVKNFLMKWHDDIVAVTTIKKSGLTLQDLMQIGHQIGDRRLSKKYWDDVEHILTNIFPGQDVEPIMSPLLVGSIGHAKGAYAETNLNYYLSKKSEQGMLFIDLKKALPTFVFFNSIEELNAAGLRLHAETTYPVTQHDLRNPYPQMAINNIKGFQAADPTPVPSAKPGLQKPDGTPGAAQKKQMKQAAQAQPVAPEPAAEQPAPAPAPRQKKTYGAANTPMNEWGVRIRPIMGHKPRF
jgi:hypothetical protein